VKLAYFLSRALWIAAGAILANLLWMAPQQELGHDGDMGVLVTFMIFCMFLAIFVENSNINK
jgi:ABC-type transport system involved in cytochrome bd biosynthesis fused ATPase/permease subunit